MNLTGQLVSESIENLLYVNQLHFPDQPINWEYLLNKFATHLGFYFTEMQEKIRFLVMCGMLDTCGSSCI